MREQDEILARGDVDGLRLLGLSRIPRCTTCPRLASLVTSWRTREPVEPPVPDAPAGCRDQVCAPMVARLVHARGPEESG